MIDLLFKYFRGEATDTDRELIGRWLDENPNENGKAYKEARFMYEASILYGDTDNQSQPTRRLTWRTVGRVAIGAAAAILLTVGAGYLSREQTYKTLSHQAVVLETPIGQRAEMVLPDGSRVWLNAATRIEYPSVFARNERRIRLSGEALFEVAPDAAHPFIVETFASEIEVLGTRFDVLAEPENNRFTTTLLRGKVKVTNRADSRNVIVMLPNEVVSLENGNLRIDTSRDSNAMCWIDGQVSFGKLPFDVLMKTFEKAFGVRIVNKCQKMPATDYSYGKVHISEGIDHALQVLQHSTGFTYTKDIANNVITVTNN